MTTISSLYLVILATRIERVTTIFVAKISLLYLVIWSKESGRCDNCYCGNNTNTVTRVADVTTVIVAISSILYLVIWSDESGRCGDRRCGRWTRWLGRNLKLWTILQLPNTDVCKSCAMQYHIISLTERLELNSSCSCTSSALTIRAPTPVAGALCS